MLNFYLQLLETYNGRVMMLVLRFFMDNLQFIIALADLI